MRGRLVRNCSLVDVPEDLTYFRRDNEYLVFNPEIGGRCVLSQQQFDVLSAVARAQRDGRPAELEETEEAERALATFILSWIVYYNGNKPAVQVGEPPLKTVYYAITEGCNLRCPYCYASSEKCLPGELTTGESLDLVSQAAAFGARQIVFTGGEPMLRKDLFEIVRHAKSLGLSTGIITNATMIRTPAIAEQFAELFDTMTISVDGGSAEVHDRTRGKGSFAKTHRAIRLLNDAGVAPQINHIVTSENIEELEDFAEFMTGVKVASVRLMNHNDLGRGATDDYDFGWQDHLRVQQIVWRSPVAGSLLPDARPKLITPCSARGNCGMGGNEVYVNSTGDVYPCKLVTGKPQLAGNVRQRSLADLFGSPVLKQMRTSTVYGGEYHADCEKCYIKAACGGGCRAYHMSESGDLKRNSRHLCRILRHGIVTNMWLEYGVSRAELAQRDQEISVPRLVATDEIHQVYDDWKAFVPAPRGAAERAAGKRLIPITPTRRRPAGAAANQ
jgi:radical SAM protein with 4Fe4S-binding SPASM domain